ncbi:MULTISPECIES: ABC transporter ATP-binding protein [Ramlibacter]|uniref:ATP-binding cassette domain-containing protein n=1 Tax=Ramlibacter aquaticus TaxID=2780094 RepID=A0ABR9SI02_9BURK|nr:MULTISPECIES: ABC transporter ATP-binding protein [Ramlibacter]MBE7941804.1 ATP-binding cassette domain-containing protein [Ramlibacter aquaticus]
MLELRGLRRLGVGPVDLRLAPGECVAIQGRSGAGKSVLLRMVADLDPHEGEALLDGQACSAMPAPQWRRLVSYVAADPGWWAEDVAGHFAAGRDLAAELPLLGLDPAAAGWAVARLSTGERQRVALLRALTPQNRVLLLDEPTSGLDPQSRDQVEALLRQRMADGGAVLLVTHDPELAQRMGHRRLRMEEGRLQAPAHEQEVHE